MAGGVKAGGERGGGGEAHGSSAEQAALLLLLIVILIVISSSRRDGLYPWCFPDHRLNTMKIAITIQNAWLQIPGREEPPCTRAGGIKAGSQAGGRPVPRIFLPSATLGHLAGSWSSFCPSA